MSTAELSNVRHEHLTASLIVKACATMCGCRNRKWCRGLQWCDGAVVQWCGRDATVRQRLEVSRHQIMRIVNECGSEGATADGW